ncbi:Hypp7735 [Branchiostoma lanceolatum]|uniref:Hypp7735 protein n=1 Tax=Branchiostoma lanceolatum TaxID=7740 RepID=A0A8J9Z3G8_BRALA|nr:Hypp7735 [Branchiostoma lanceolatum]
MEDLWRQHTEEMALLEGSTFTINEAIVTFEFVPSADQKWQCWANNETTNAATFPSPFADVSKETMAIVNGQIGEAWQPWTHASRTVDAAKVQKFIATLPSTIAESTRRTKINNYLSSNRMRQLGTPRIGIYAELQRPDPLHAEINVAAHYLNLIYHEAVSRGSDCFSRFIDILGGPVHCTEQDRIGCVPVSRQGGGDFNVGEGAGARARACASVADASQSLVDSLEDTNDSSHVQSQQLLGLGLKSLAKDLLQHYSNEATRHSKCPGRLIGEHAILLESFSFRLVDGLRVPEESQTQQIRRVVLAKVTIFPAEYG